MTRDEALSVLGLEPGASRAEISSAHRELAQMLHPDKFGENKRLRARAEQQMKRVNEARDALLKGTAGSSYAGAASAGGKDAARRGASSPEEILFEARARARAAETARLSVVAQLRTMRERRRSMVVMAAVAAIVAFLLLRVRGGLGAMIASIASMVAVWGIVDAVMLTSQIEALRKRSRELLQTRDAARRVADEAAML